jgi:hypothetical protein
MRAEAQALRRAGNGLVTVVAPTLALRWWQRLLYSTDTSPLRAAVADLPGAAVIEHRLPLALA